MSTPPNSPAVLPSPLAALPDMEGRSQSHVWRDSTREKSPFLLLGNRIPERELGGRGRRRPLSQGGERTRRERLRSPHPCRTPKEGPAESGKIQAAAEGSLQRAHHWLGLPGGGGGAARDSSGGCSAGRSAVTSAPAGVGAGRPGARPTLASPRNGQRPHVGTWSRRTAS